MKKYLALFDLDGTLFDTGEVNYISYQKTLKLYGINLDKEYFIRHCNGRHYTEFIPEIMGTDKHIEEVHRIKKNSYKSYLGFARENEHLFNIIEVLQDKYYTAVVTTASRENTEDILRYFNRLKLFDDLITYEDVTKTKPDPQGFRIAMERFSISPDKTMIFEDSDVGIKAAKASCATVFTVSQLGVKVVTDGK